MISYMIYLTIDLTYFYNNNHFAHKVKKQRKKNASHRLIVMSQNATHRYELVGTRSQSRLHSTEMKQKKTKKTQSNNLTADVCCCCCCSVSV